MWWGTCPEGRGTCPSFFQLDDRATAMAAAPLTVLDRAAGAAAAVTAAVLPLPRPRRRPSAASLLYDPVN